MFCNKCGYQLSENSVFCTSCGNQIESSTQNSVSVSSPTTKEGWMLEACRDAILSCLKAPMNAKFEPFKNIETDAYGRTLAFITVYSTNSYNAMVPSVYCVCFYDVTDHFPCTLVPPGPQNVGTITGITDKLNVRVAKNLFKFGKPRNDTTSPSQEYRTSSTDDAEYPTYTSNSASQTVNAPIVITPAPRSTSKFPLVFAIVALALAALSFLLGTSVESDEALTGVSIFLGFCAIPFSIIALSLSNKLNIRPAKVLSIIALPLAALSIIISIALL